MEFSGFLNEPIGGSKYFTWKEALWLPRWRIHAVPASAAIIANIEATAHKMNLLREFFDRPLVVTSWYRPPTYNALIGGAARSAHQDGLACDFLVHGEISADCRALLKEHLQEFNIRLEADATPHLHIDLRCAAAHSNEMRFFNSGAKLS